MIALEMLGMIEARHGLGIYVTGDVRPITPASAEPAFEIGAFELIEARRLFEGEAAALAATAITDDQIQELEALMERMARERKSSARTPTASSTWSSPARPGTARSSPRSRTSGTGAIARPWPATS
jgi:DNA-binding FadR family transcriptional regulator